MIRITKGLNNLLCFVLLFFWNQFPEKKKIMSHDEGTGVQSLKATLPLYVTETRDAAETITTFATNTAAQQLGSVLQGSASAVEQGIVELSNNANRVVKILNEENQMLRAELLKTWQALHRCSDTVAEVENAQRSGMLLFPSCPAVVGASRAVLRSLQMHSSEGAEAGHVNCRNLYGNLQKQMPRWRLKRNYSPSIRPPVRVRCNRVPLSTVNTRIRVANGRCNPWRTVGEARAFPTQSLRSMSTGGSLRPATTT